MSTCGRFSIICILQIYIGLLANKEHLFTQKLCGQYRNYWVRGSDLCRDIVKSNDCSSLTWHWNLWISIPEGPHAIDAPINGTSGWLPGGKRKFQLRESETLALAQLPAKGHLRWRAVLTASQLSLGCLWTVHSTALAFSFFLLLQLIKRICVYTYPCTYLFFF